MEFSSVTGIEDIPQSDLIEIRKAIDEELARRRSIRAKVAEGLGAELNAMLKQVLCSGCRIVIETDTDEIEITSCDKNVVRAIVAPAE